MADRRVPDSGARTCGDALLLAAADAPHHVVAHQRVLAHLHATHISLTFQTPQVRNTHHSCVKPDPWRMLSWSKLCAAARAHLQAQDADHVLRDRVAPGPLDRGGLQVRVHVRVWVNAPFGLQVPQLPQKPCMPQFGGTDGMWPATRLLRHDYISPPI